MFDRLPVIRYTGNSILEKRTKTGGGKKMGNGEIRSDARMELIQNGKGILKMVALWTLSVGIAASAEIGRAHV